MLKDRDIRQRTFGFISFSFLAHLGIIAASFLTPNVLKENAAGTKDSETYLVEPSIPASLGETAQALPEVAPVEEVVAEPVPQEVLTAKLPVKETKLPAKKVSAPARENAVVATKKVLALPAKKAAPVKAANEIQTVDQSEVEISQALKASRESEQRPEVAADIEVPEIQEQQEESEEVAQMAVVNEPVESATTASAEVSEEETTQTPMVQQRPLIAPITRGTQAPPPSGQIGGLGTTGTVASPPATTGGIAAGTGAGRGAGTGAAGVIRDADTLVEQPGNIKPSYAEADQRAGRQGTVVFDAVVNRDGTVQAIQMKQSSGYSSLDASAYEAFKRHRYLPGQEGTVRKKFQFVLNGEQEARSRLRRR